MTEIIGILLNGGVGVIGFFGGRLWEKNDQREKLINGKIEKVSEDIQQLSTVAVKFYLTEMDECTRSAETAMIGSAFKRLNIELHSLCQLAKLNSSEFIGVLNGFHYAVTAEPYGEKQIKPMFATDDRISSIQVTEVEFLRKLKTLERV